MIVLGRDVLTRAGQRHRGKKLERSLETWAAVVDAAKWRHFPDVRKTWGSADYVSKSDCVVFNIKGNQFRLLARVNYRLGIVSVLEVLTHAEYQKWSDGL